MAEPEKKEETGAGAAAADEQGEVTLVSSDGQKFTISRKKALLSGTLKAMLTGSGPVDHSGEVELKEITGPILAKVVEYFEFRLKYENTHDEIPEFPIKAEEALDLLMAANYLDC
jgi:transcription elongation factor B subunit 1